MPIDTALVTILVNSEEAMTRLGHVLADHLIEGDTLLLYGPIGAGKSHLARAIIQSLIGENEEVPSPTYTLVQTYDTGRGSVWHADLYRLGDGSELLELGLEDAIGEDIVLVEWPDRLSSDIRPSSALEVNITPENDTRMVTFSSNSRRWHRLLDCLSND